MSTERGVDVLHLDMDCFFAAVEMLDDPALRARPVVVGGTGNRGVVSSASYEARAYGVRSAMPTAEARRLCPDAVFIHPRHDRYSEVSAELAAILADVTPIVEPISLDEAFLDVRGAHRVLGSTTSIATGLRARVASELHLDCAVGGGRSKLIAKLASKAAKPEITPAGPRPGRGVVIIGPEEERGFLDSHQVRALPGIGPRSAERLARLGVTEVSELARLDRGRLVALFGKSQGSYLHDLANGVDDRPVEADRALKSIGHEETFERDLFHAADLEARVRASADSVAARCRSSQLFGRTVSLKLKFNDFSTITRARSAPQPLLRAAEITEIALELLGQVERTLPVRLLGISVSNLSSGDEPRQLDLFATQSAGEGPAPARLEALESVTDEIRRRFGEGALDRGAKSTPTRAGGHPRPTMPAPAENRTAENRPAENRPAENRPAENRPGRVEGGQAVRDNVVLKTRSRSNGQDR
jgi:DNA polymerase IV